MEKPCKALTILIKKMRHNILKLLRLLYRSKSIQKAIPLLMTLRILLLTHEVRIHTHQPGHPTNILIPEGRDKIGDALRIGLRTDVEQDAEFGVDVAAEALEEPEMGGEFGAVYVFEAGDQF
jgi:hypothetical protein